MHALLVKAPQLPQPVRHRLLGALSLQLTHIRENTANL
jgi:hypothetical protein